jgi:hypothetical protein
MKRSIHVQTVLANISRQQTRAAIVLLLLASLPGRQALAQFAGGGGGAFGGGPAPAKEIAPEFLKEYAVGSGKALVWIKPPFLPSRRDAYISLDPAARMAGGSSAGWPIIPGGMIVQWVDGAPTLKAKTPRLDQRFTVLGLLAGIYGPALAQPKADRRTLATEIDGDFVLKAGAREEDLSQPLGEILSSALGQKVNVQVRQDEAEVYVLSGEFKYTPITDELWQQTVPAGRTRPRESSPHFYIYSTDLGPQQPLPAGAPKSWNRRLNSTGGDIGTLQDILSERINAPVVIEARGFPGRFAYDDHGNVIADGDAGEATNTKLILDHLAGQTGLTWKKETRQLRRVMILLLQQNPGA